MEKILTDGLRSLGFKQSTHDPCLFIKNTIMYVIYVDDTIFFSLDEKIIDTYINSLKQISFDLTDEGYVDAFLGVNVINHPNGSITLLQPGLTINLLELLGMTNDSKWHDTPAVNPPTCPSQWR